MAKKAPDPTEGPAVTRTDAWPNGIQIHPEATPSPETTPAPAAAPDTPSEE